MLRVKAGVNVTNLCPEMWYAIGYAAAVHAGITTADTVITSGNDGEHMEGSLHYAGRAVDLRTQDMSADACMTWARRVRVLLAAQGFDVVLEFRPPHLHIEYDPKPGEHFSLPPLPPEAPAKPQGESGASQPKEEA